MLKSISSALLTSLLFLFGTSATAQTDAATAEALMRSSGLWKQLESTAPQMRAGLASALAQGKTPVAPAEIERLSRIADAAFAAQRLRAVAQRVIASGTKQAHVAALTAWYRSPAGVNFAKLEEDASAQERDPALAMQEDSAFLSTLPASRQARLSQFVEVTRSAEALTNMTINMGIAVQSGAASALPGAPTVSATEMRRAMDAQRPQMLRAFAGLALATYARTYATVSDAELSKYIAFLKSAAGMQFTDVSLRALDAALVDAAGELGRNIPSARESSRT